MMNYKKTILLLGDVNSVHLHKWIVALKEQFVVLVFSIDKLEEQNEWLRNVEGVRLFDSLKNTSNSGFSFLYFRQIRRLKTIYKKYQPDITHAHYATSYGLLGAFCNPKKYCISVWGTDVYFFPKTSFLHKMVFKWILKKADYLFATSKNLSTETQLYTRKTIQIIPFGIDTTLFSPIKSKNETDVFTIGTVKGLHTLYGIDRLIDAFADFNKKYPKSHCLIYGEGPYRKEFEQQITKLGMDDKIKLKGFIENKKVPIVLNSFDIYCALSRSESFGVAVVEASACEIPVIVSNIGGLTEVVRPNETGFIVNAESKQEIVDSMEQLYQQKELRQTFGQKGREYVSEHYEWSRNVEQQINFYIDLLNGKN
jgi:glycosyltransferase involved in cell wall biosynthesis